MKLKDKLKEKPLLNLLIIPIQLLIAYLFCYVLLFLDAMIWKPKPGVLGTPFPIIFTLGLPVLIIVTIIVSIVAIVRTIKYSKNKKKQEE